MTEVDFVATHLKNTQIARSYRTEATKVLDGFDLARFGSFVIDTKILRLGIAKQLMLADGFPADNAAYQIISSDVVSQSRELDLGGVWEADCIFILIEQGIAADYTRKILNSFRELDEDFFGGRVALLTNILNHPEMLPYAEVGVRDWDYIRHCIVNEIDPELAISLEGGGR